MFVQTSIFILFLASSWASHQFIKFDNVIEKAEYPEKIPDSKTLTKFLELVEKHKLNVSLIVSSVKNYEDDNVKEALAMTFTLPVNGESIKKPTLDKEAFGQLAEVANKEKLTVAGTVATNNKLKIATNNRKELPINKAWKIFTGIKNGRTGFVMDEENYVAQYTFIVPGDDGKNQTTVVFHGDVDIKVLHKSDNIKDEDLDIIKKAVLDGIFMSDENHAPRAIVALLDKNLPDHSWEAAGPIGENSYIDSENYVLLQFVWGDKFLVYSS